MSRYGRAPSKYDRGSSILKAGRSVGDRGEFEVRPSITRGSSSREAGERSLQGGVPEGVQGSRRRGTKESPPVGQGTVEGLRERCDGAASEGATKDAETDGTQAA